MASEAKFSVIFPASGFISSQLESFESIVQKNGLSVTLPLSQDKSGNYIISSGLSLRDAQILRRQVSGYGFNADVISDAVRTQNAKSNSTGETASDEPLNNPMDAADVLASLEIPDLDLGLSDGAVLDENAAEWNGDNWLDPDVTSSRTVSVNAQALLEVARESGDYGFEDVNAIQNIPILENADKPSDNNAQPLKPFSPDMAKKSDDKPTLTALMKDRVSIEERDLMKTDDLSSLSLDIECDEDQGAIKDPEEKLDLMAAMNHSADTSSPEPLVPLLTTQPAAESVSSESTPDKSASENPMPEKFAPENMTPEKSESENSSPDKPSPEMNPESPEKADKSSENLKRSAAASRRNRDSIVSEEFMAMDMMKQDSDKKKLHKSRLPVFLIVIVVVIVVAVVVAFFLIPK